MNLKNAEEIIDIFLPLMTNPSFLDLDLLIYLK